MQKQAKSQTVTKQQVKSMITSALVPNYADFSTSSTTTTTPTFVDMTSLAPGTGQNLRSGSSVSLKKLTFYYNTTLADSTNFVRIVIFKWFPSSTSDVPTAAELFFGGGGQVWSAPFFGGHPSRFKVLFDKLIALDAAHVVEIGKVVLKLNHLVEYDNGVNTGKNHLYYSICSDSGGVPNPSFVINTQLQFTE